MIRPSIAALLIVGGLALPGRAADAQLGPDTLKPMIQSDSLVFNGFTRSKDGRAFSPFQRQAKGTGLELGEWRDGQPVAFPDAAWNAWKPG
ncbi:hypothetical protein FML87_35675, partial [Rhizobium leguminosarum bv. phaseoli]|nr:hypothetical protein [Rhizobium leguminosarum bv. phaseoli]